MPARAPTPCRKPGCAQLVRDRSGYCGDHQGERTNWAQHQRGRTPKDRGYGWRWTKLRALVIARDKGLCQMCRGEGMIRAGNECDHITPRSQGGTDDLDNLQLLCRAHHASKTAREG